MTRLCITKIRSPRHFSPIEIRSYRVRVTLNGLVYYVQSTRIESPTKALEQSTLDKCNSSSWQVAVPAISYLSWDQGSQAPV